MIFRLGFFYSKPLFLAYYPFLYSNQIWNIRKENKYNLQWGKIVFFSACPSYRLEFCLSFLFSFIFHLLLMPDVSAWPQVSPRYKPDCTMRLGHEKHEFFPPCNSNGSSDSIQQWWLFFSLWYAYDNTPLRPNHSWTGQTVDAIHWTHWQSLPNLSSDISSLWASVFQRTCIIINRGMIIKNYILRLCFRSNKSECLS